MSDYQFRANSLVITMQSCYFHTLCYQLKSDWEGESLWKFVLMVVYIIKCISAFCSHMCLCCVKCHQFIIECRLCWIYHTIKDWCYQNLIICLFVNYVCIFFVVIIISSHVVYDSSRHCLRYLWHIKLKQENIWGLRWRSTSNQSASKLM